MQTGVCQWCFARTVPTFDAMATARECGYEAFEVGIGLETYVSLSSSTESLSSLRRHADGLGLTLSSAATGVGWQYPLTSNDRAKREKGVALTTQAMEVAAELGVKTLLIVPGTVDMETRFDDAFENGVASLRSLVRRAETLGVSLAVENVWSNFLLNPEELRQFVDQCGSPKIGVYLDVGNVILYGYPEKWIQSLKGRILGVHINDFKKGMPRGKGFVMPGEGEVDWPQVIMALKSVGYDGALTIEYEAESGAIGTKLRQALARLKVIQTLKGF
tara:strand:- start:275 stop:1099 length:825 start_codon:yes stop_codon:yes gene_type:complete